MLLTENSGVEDTSSSSPVNSARANYVPGPKDLKTKSKKELTLEVEDLQIKYKHEVSQRTELEHELERIRGTIKDLVEEVLVLRKSNQEMRSKLSMQEVIQFDEVDLPPIKIKPEKNGEKTRKISSTELPANVNNVTWGTEVKSPKKTSFSMKKKK